MNVAYLLVAAVILAGSGCERRADIAVAEAPRVEAPKTVLAPPPVIEKRPAVAEPGSQVIVLGYHRFVSKVRRPDTEITPQLFEAQLKALKENRISVISLRDFMAWKRGEKSIPAVCALITIDDGYKSAYAVAWPILKKFEYPFTLFVYTDYIKGGPKSGGESINWEQLAEMRDAGVEIQSHTVSHRDLRGKRQNTDAVYEKWLWNELHHSRALIEERLGVSVKALAVPYGAYNEHVREVAAKAGYELLFTVDGQKIDAGTPSDALGRYIIESNKPKIFADAIVFEKPQSQEAIVTLKAKTEPEDGAVLKIPPVSLRAQLDSFGAIDPGSVTMRMSGAGALPAVYDPQAKTIIYQPTKPLKADRYAVIISATCEGRKVEARWNFVIEPSGISAPLSAANVSRR